MDNRRNIVVIACVIILVVLSGCDKTVLDAGYANVRGASTPETDYSPEETVRAALDYLKEADIKGFNQYVCYPVKREGVVVSGYNIMFGNSGDEEEERFINKIAAELSYDLGIIKIEEDRAEVAAVISNQDLSNSMFLETVSDTESQGIVTKEILISLVKKDSVWKIVADEDFQEAVSGGLFRSASDIPDEIMDSIFGWKRNGV